jgi:hypothetical protein
MAGVDVVTGHAAEPMDRSLVLSETGDYDHRSVDEHPERQSPLGPSRKTSVCQTGGEVADLGD